MSNNRFEQLIEYVINDEEAKAKELFHQIVVEKSRAIYESMMDDESIEEAREEEEESIEEDNAMGEEPVEVDSGVSESLGGDQSDDLISDVEAEEEGVMMDDEEEEEVEFSDDDGFGDEGDEAAEGDLEDRVVKLEDELDNLMAEFEAMMDGGEEVDAEVDAFDTPDMTDGDVADDEFETEGMMEAVTLKAAPKPTTSEEGNTNKKSIVAANSGARGALASPVKPTGTEAHGRAAPGTKELIGKVGNTPAQSTQKPSAAKKPTTSQASGVNNKSPLPGGRG